MLVYLFSIDFHFFKDYMFCLFVCLFVFLFLVVIFPLYIKSNQFEIEPLKRPCIILK